MRGERPLSGPEQWQVTATTAAAITGNIGFSPDRIAFQNGEFLTLAPVGSITVN